MRTDQAHMDVFETAAVHRNDDIGRATEAAARASSPPVPNFRVP